MNEIKKNEEMELLMSLGNKINELEKKKKD